MITALVDDRALALLNQALTNLADLPSMNDVVARYRALIKNPRKRRRADKMPSHIMEQRQLDSRLHREKNDLEADSIVGWDDSWSERNQYYEQLLKDSSISTMEGSSEMSGGTYDDDEDIVMGKPYEALMSTDSSEAGGVDKNNPDYNFFHLKVKNLEKYAFSEAIDELMLIDSTEVKEFCDGAVKLLKQQIIGASEIDFDDVSLARLHMIQSHGKAIAVNRKTQQAFHKLDQKIIEASVALTGQTIAKLNEADALLKNKVQFEQILCDSSLPLKTQRNYFTVINDQLNRRLPALGEATGWQADFKRLVCGRGAKLSFLKLLGEASEGTVKRAQLEAMVQVKEDLWEDICILQAAMEQPDTADWEAARLAVEKQDDEPEDLYDIAIQMAHYRHLDTLIERQQQLAGWSGEFIDWCRQQLNQA